MSFTQSIFCSRYVTMNVEGVCLGSLLVSSCWQGQRIQVFWGLSYPELYPPVLEPLNYFHTCTSPPPPPLGLQENCANSLFFSKMQDLELGKFFFFLNMDSCLISIVDPSIIAFVMHRGILKGANLNDIYPVCIGILQRIKKWCLMDRQYRA